jgi:hypothetical protein
MENHVILGIHITDRLQHAVEVQKVFTEFGRHIKTRLGLHELDKSHNSPNGIVLIEWFGDEAKAHEMAAKLNAIAGVEVKQMVFGH